MRTRAIFILLVITVFSCFSRNTEGNDISELGFYGSPEKIIASLEKKPVGYREHFMLGTAYRKKGNLKKALLHFSNSCFTSHRSFSLKLFPQPVYAFVKGMHIKSELYDDALAGIADIFQQYREFDYTVKFTHLLRKQNTALYRDAVILRAKALDDLNRDREALKELQDILDDYDDTGSGSLIYLRMASLHEKMDAPREALNKYIGIFKLDSASWQASIAASRACAILTAKSVIISPEESRLLAGALYASSKYPEAIELLKDPAVAGQAKENSARAEITALLIRCHVRSGNLREADALIRRFGAADEMLKVKADELWNSRKKAAAVAVYRTLRASTLESVSRESLKRICLHMEDNSVAGFEKELTSFKDTYPADSVSEYFLWLLGRAALKRSDNKSAESFFVEGLTEFPRGEYSDRFRFWLYKLYGSEGKKEEAEKKFREMVVNNPDSSYTWRLLQQKSAEYKQEELQETFNSARKGTSIEAMLFAHTLLFIKDGDLKKRDTRLKAVPSGIRAGYEEFTDALKESGMKSKYKSNLKQLERYFVIGYQEGIVRELSAIPDDSGNRDDKNIALSSFGEKYHNSYFMVNSTLELMRSRKIYENIAMLPAGVLRRILPAPFAGCVAAGALEFDVEKAALYAVMKAESLFNHRAVSPAGAAGLMQLMPATAKGIARTLSMKEHDLKDPCISVRMGAHYVAWLNRFFKGNFDHMVAGYNAGAGNVRKWQKGTFPDSDYFMEFIPFDETRYYILRTGKFLQQYRILEHINR